MRWKDGEPSTAGGIRGTPNPMNDPIERGWEPTVEEKAALEQSMAQPPDDSSARPDSAIKKLDGSREKALDPLIRLSRNFDGATSEG